MMKAVKMAAAALAVAALLSQSALASETTEAHAPQSSSCDVKWIVKDSVLVKQGEVALSLKNISTNESETLLVLKTEADEDNAELGLSTTYTIAAKDAGDGDRRGQAEAEISKLAPEKRSGILAVADISIKKTVYNNDAGATESEAPVESTSENIKLSVEIPAELERANRSFWVVREHDGSLDVLRNVSETPGVVEFFTDKFSEYYFGYVDDAQKVSVTKAYFASAKKPAYKEGTVLTGSDFSIKSADQVLWSDGVTENKNAAEVPSPNVVVLSGAQVRAGSNSVRILFTDNLGGAHTFTLNVEGLPKTTGQENGGGYGEEEDGDEEVAQPSPSPTAAADVAPPVVSLLDVEATPSVQEEDEDCDDSGAQIVSAKKHSDGELGVAEDGVIKTTPAPSEEPKDGTRGEPSATWSSLLPLAIALLVLLVTAAVVARALKGRNDEDEE